MNPSYAFAKLNRSIDSTVAVSLIRMVGLVSVRVVLVGVVLGALFGFSVSCDAQETAHETAHETVEAQSELGSPEEQVLHIFKTRCFRCHSGNQADGDLRLDSRSAIMKGGHTGNPLLADSADDSELYRRITSDSDDIRMPKEGMPLSPEQIVLFKTWIETGAKWPAEKPASSKSWTDRAGAWLTDMQTKLSKPRYQYFHYIGIALGAWLFILLLLYVLKRRRKKSNPENSNPVGGTIGGSIARWLVTLSILLCGVIAYFAGFSQELQEDKTQLERRLAKFTKPKNSVSFDPNNPTTPPHPMHPKRMGGVYYRGNDERSPHLFNGGFYRTAELEVWFEDSDGKRLNWNDKISDQPLFVAFSLQKAKGATDELFNSNLIKTTYLKHFPKSKNANDADDADAPEPPNAANAPNTSTKFTMDEVEPGKRWVSKVELPPPSQWTESKTSGMLYVFHGAQNVEGQTGRVHYGITYHLSVSEPDLKIAENSEVWMGSLYNLNGRVLLPSEKTILLDHWFDFRPIPQIEGENSTDPSLLGLPEHLK